MNAIDLIPSFNSPVDSLNSPVSLFSHNPTSFVTSIIRYWFAKVHSKVHSKVHLIVYSKVYKKHISLFIVGTIGSIDDLIENHAKIIHFPNDRYDE